MKLFFIIFNIMKTTQYTLFQFQKIYIFIIFFQSLKFIIFYLFNTFITFRQNLYLKKLSKIIFIVRLLNYINAFKNLLQIQSTSRPKSKTLKQMIKSDRSSKKQSQFSKISFNSDRQNNSIHNHNNNSKIRLPNQQVQSLRSSKVSQTSNKSRNKISIFQNIIHSLVPQIFLPSQKLCEICQSSYPQQQLKQFGPCKHSFCQTCLKQYVQFKIQNFQLIMCPLQGCKTKLDKQGHVYRLILTQEDRIKYDKIQLQIQILSDSNLRQCKNQNCTGIVNLKTWKQSLILNPNTLLNCIKCKLQYCKQCFEAKHQGGCQKNIIKFLQRNKKFRQCQKCKRVIQKTQGCTHMTCLCGFYFCYMCGQQLSGGDHQCNIPSHLNCLQKIRWQIQHKQMFYESNLLSFHKCLYCFDLSIKIPMVLRFFYSLLYTMSVYPISIVLFLVLVMLFLVLVIVFLVLMFVFLPLSEVCGTMDYRMTIFVNEMVGSYGLALIVILFYPLFIIGIMIQAIMQLWKQQQNCQQIYLLFVQLGIGFRNILLMPLVLCINPQSLDDQQNVNAQNRIQQIKV